ncbi:MAG: alanine acetyltransferase [Rhodobacteraceae bacterium]|nr:alanine acetyltransferase [Paracoccaceae bacterium]MAY47395.1 alanine acetyltransferase [Paracoccaceae bacterium]|tara:strand:- start:170 stop:718 length:549 start_codon:yes stop_codon:yes gene_type:complete
MTTSYTLPDGFDTARCHLRRVSEADAQGIFESYATDADVTRYLGWTPHASVARTADFLRSAAAEWDSGTGFPLVAFHRGHRADPIGMFHPHPIGHRVNYGNVLRASAWGNGIASEIMTWLVDHALAHPAIFRAEAFCDVENPASARVMEKAGMTREGILRRYFRHPNVSDAPRDCVIYSKVR